MALEDSAMPLLFSENYTLYDAFDPSVASEAPFQVSARDILWAVFWAWAWPIVSWGLAFLQVYAVCHHFKARWDIAKEGERHVKVVDIYQGIITEYRDIVAVNQSVLAKYKGIVIQYQRAIAKHEDIAAQYGTTIAEYKGIVARNESTIAKYKGIVTRNESTIDTYEDTVTKYKSAVQTLDKHLKRFERGEGPARVLNAAAKPLRGVLDRMEAWDGTLELIRRAVDLGVLEGEDVRAVVESLEDVVREMNERVGCFSGCLLGLRKTLDDEGDKGTAEFLRAWLPDQRPRAPRERTYCWSKDGAGEDLVRLFSDAET